MAGTSTETAQVTRPNPAELTIPSPWLTSVEACAYLRFTGSDRLNSLYRFVAAHGIRKRYRSPRRLLFSRADLDAALAGTSAARRRNVIARAGVTA